ncbi:M15 family metallopeptidase [Pararhizobium sp. BT-229]|uniref:M15 family metallopeptidase n=1 Tax=Pararhizobium sp. BT-229 TaxID=2986923 RepID=UPI0021F6DA30|nr:M15 family metallopeptidase [Pararhizobium sp. BT-229]MCV9965716.1 M15 family metallopeptidase [Pararhizobium sp. BT-229]
MADKSDDLIISISTDLATVRRSLKRLEGDIAATSGNVVKQFDKMGKGIDNSMATALQTRIDKMVGIGTQGAKEWTGALADQGKELERLRARYSPLFATITNYKTAVNDIKRAHALGAISATEMTAAITKERQAALASTAAIKGRNAALKDTPAQRGGGSFNASNLAAQGFDTITTAPFMPWYTVALQQGPQVAQVFNDIRASGQAVGPAVAGAFAQILNPMSLVTIGVIAASAAAIQYFSTMEWGGGKSEETLKKEAELIDAVTQKWGEALPELKAYNDERKRLAENQDIKQAAALEADNQWTDLRKSLADVNIEFVDIVSQMQQLGKEQGQVGDLHRSFNDLAKGVEDGTATSEMAKKVQSDLAAIIKDGSTPAIDGLKKVIDDLVPSLDKAHTNAEKLVGSASALVDIVQKLGPLGQLSPIISGDGKFMTDANEIQTYRAQQEANKNPLIESNGRMMGVPTPGQKPNQLGEEPNKKAGAAASRAANAYRELLKSADDRIGQLRLETELLGQYGSATDAARFRLDLLQQSEDKGRSLSEAQKAEIEGKVAAYEKYSKALAQAKFNQDMLDEARLSGMSNRDQEITQRLRQYGLSEDLGGENASKIRKQLQVDELSGAADAFIDDLSGALLSGGDDIGKKLADVLLNSLLDSAQEQVSSILKQIFKAVISPSGGASPVGAATSALSYFPAAPSGTFAAPVGAVSRAALPAAGATRTGIGLSTISTASGLTADVNAKYASQFQSLVKDLEATGYNIKSIGGYSHRNIAGTSKLSNHAYGNAIDINPMANPDTGRGGALITDMPASVSEIASRNGFSWGGDWKSKKDAMHFEIAQSKSAGAALEKLAGASNESTKGLSNLATNLASGGAGGGGGGWLSFLAGSPFAGSGQLAASGGIGLFDKGGYTGPGGKMTPAGIVHKGEYVFDAETVARLGVPTLEKLRGYANGGLVGAPVAPRLNARRPSASNQNGPSTLTVQINGASGDPHVRELVRQGVAEALAAKNDNDRRGGFASMQQRAASQKG